MKSCNWSEECIQLKGKAKLQSNKFLCNERTSIKMVEKSEEVQGVKIIAVIDEAIRIYKANYKLFLKITFFIFLTEIFSAVINYFLKVFKYNSSILFLVLNMLPFLIYIIVIYFATKLSVALYAGISERYKNNDIDFKGTLSIASEKIWRYIGVDLQLFLILVIPGLIVFISFFYVKNPFIKYVLVSVFSLVFIYLSTIYKFAPIITVFEKDKMKYFTMSKLMVKGDFIRVAFLTVFLPFTFSPPIFLYFYIFDRPQLNPLNSFIFTSINSMFHIFITPFTTLLVVVLYYKLIKTKRIGLEKPHNKKLMTRLMKMKF